MFEEDEEEVQEALRWEVKEKSINVSLSILNAY